MNGVYELTLRAPGGEQRTTLVWLPTPEVQRDYHEKAARRGLTIANEKIIL
jgi:hypothetical protein